MNYQVSSPLRRRSAFTLVELLVVVGIIAIMVGILLPAMSRARENARMVQCLSNLRQISTATVMYCNENKGAYPGRGGFGADALFNNDIKKHWGWIAWRRKVDPVTGMFYSDNNAWDHNITYSALAIYLNYRFVDHNPTNSTAIPDLAAANDVAPDLDRIYRCPSDNLWQRKNPNNDINGGRGFYRYSYSMNICFGNKKPVLVAGNYTLGGKPHTNLSRVRRASQKIVYMDESEKSVNNGEYNPTTTLADADDVTKDYSAIAERHEAKKLQNSQDARGNVAFADGHAEFFSRRDAFDVRYYDPDLP